MIDRLDRPFGSKQFDLNEHITAKFITAIEKGTLPWRKPWKTKGGYRVKPRNLVSDKPYRGVNHLLLSMAPYESPYWLTYKQAQEKGGNIARGQESTMIVFWKTDERENEAGELKKSFLLRYYRVFNWEQTEGITNPEPPDLSLPSATIIEPIVEAERIAEANALPKPAIGGDKACYWPALDLIKMPSRNSFDCAESYYGTLFHEQIHATGHKSRLNRKGIAESQSFGTHEYSKEELVAEIGASFVCNEIGILDDAQFDNSAAYLANWLHVLKSDSKLIISAAGKAQAAADLVLNIN